MATKWLLISQLVDGNIIVGNIIIEITIGRPIITGEMTEENRFLFIYVCTTKISSILTAFRQGPINCIPIGWNGPSCTESHFVIQYLGTLLALYAFSI